MKIYHWLLLIVVACIVVGCSNNKETIKKNNELEELENVEVHTLMDGEEENFQELAGVVSDHDGNIYFSDLQNHVIYRKSIDGDISIFAGYVEEVDDDEGLIGGFQDGPILEAQFNEPNGLAIDSEQNLYVADSGNGAIRKITPVGEVETVVEDLQYPFDLVVTEAGEIFFTDALLHQIFKVTTDGKLEVFAGGGYKQEDDSFIGAYKDGIGKDAQFNEPSGLAMTPNGNILVADAANQRIRLIDQTGNVSTVAGSSDSFIAGTPYVQGAFEDASAMEARFNFPKDIIAFSEDEFIVADTYNHALRYIHDGEVTTLIGTGYASFIDGDQENASFYHPYALTTLDDQIIVVDQTNRVIREVLFTKK